MNDRHHPETDVRIMLLRHKMRALLGKMRSTARKQKNTKRAIEALAKDLVARKEPDNYDPILETIDPSD